MIPHSTHTPMASATTQATLPLRHPAGSWRLERGHAVRICAKEAAIIRINAGRVWATLDGPHYGPANNQGDRVMAAGEQLTVPAGQGLVIEPWDIAPGILPASPASSVPELDGAFFSWDPLPAPQPESDRATVGTAARTRLRTAVGEPLHELGLALWQVARALGHLVAGVAGLGEFLVAGRGRVLARLESNAP